MVPLHVWLCSVLHANITEGFVTSDCCIGTSTFNMTATWTRRTAGSLEPQKTTDGLIKHQKIRSNDTFACPKLQCLYQLIYYISINATVLLSWKNIVKISPVTLKSCMHLLAFKLQMNSVGHCGTVQYTQEMIEKLAKALDGGDQWRVLWVLWMCNCEDCEAVDKNWY